MCLHGGGQHVLSVGEHKSEILDAEGSQLPLVRSDDFPRHRLRVVFSIAKILGTHRAADESWIGLDLELASCA